MMQLVIIYFQIAFGGKKKWQEAVVGRNDL